MPFQQYKLQFTYHEKEDKNKIKGQIAEISRTIIFLFLKIVNYDLLQCLPKVTTWQGVGGAAYKEIRR